jgi:hypothetical protein
VLTVRLAIAKVNLLDVVHKVLIGEAEARPEELPHRSACECEATNALLEFVESKPRVARVPARLRGVLCSVKDLAMENKVDDLVFHSPSRRLTDGRLSCGRA